MNAEAISLVHGANIAQKKAHRTKYRDDLSVQYLAEIEERYLAWKEANLAITASDQASVEERVALLNEYKDFIDQQKYAEKFDSRSNLHSTVLEEFLVHLFRNSIPHLELDPVVGKGETFKSFYIAPMSFGDLLTTPNVKIETKDHDFVIGATFTTTFKSHNGGEISEEVFQVPAVSIECKTYLDKTMLEGAAGDADELKRINPAARSIVVAEWLKLSTSVNLRKYRLDQIYVLRRQKNTDREFRYAEDYEKNPIYADLVWDLHQYVVDYLSTERWDVEEALKTGKLL